MCSVRLDRADSDTCGPVVLKPGLRKRSRLELRRKFARSIGNTTPPREVRKLWRICRGRVWSQHWSSDVAGIDTRRMLVVGLVIVKLQTTHTNPLASRPPAPEGERATARTQCAHTNSVTQKQGRESSQQRRSVPSQGAERAALLCAALLPQSTRTVRRRSSRPNSQTENVTSKKVLKYKSERR